MKFKKEHLLLYLVTDSRWTYDKTLPIQVEDAIQGGVTMVQYREKTLIGKEYIENAFAIKKICNKHKVPFVIDDNLVLAKEIGADGVHLGQNDAAIDYARIVLGDDKIIGASAHNVKEALKAQQDGADYIGVGAVFGSKTKTNVCSMTPELLKKIKASVSIPVVAIGGINENNIGLLKNSGVDGVAVVSAILAKLDVKNAAKEMKIKVQEIVND